MLRPALRVCVEEGKFRKEIMEGFNLGDLGDFPSISLDSAPGSDEYSYLARKVKIEQLTYVLGEDDPKEVILKRLGDVLDNLPEVYGSRVLVATAPTPVKKSSILLTQTSRDKAVEEGRWQGKVGYVLKLGVSAFLYDPRYPAYTWPGGPDERTPGPHPGVGDWVYYNTSDAREVGLSVSDGIAISARIIWDSDIMGRIQNDIERVF